jgi:hypothetical protein
VEGTLQLISIKTQWCVFDFCFALLQERNGNHRWKLIIQLRFITGLFTFLWKMVYTKILINDTKAICEASKRIFELSSLKSEGIQRFLCDEVIHWLINIYSRDKSDESKIERRVDLDGESNLKFEVEKYDF